MHDQGPTIVVPSNTTVYLAGGAVVKSTLSGDRADNVRIAGRGVLYQPARGLEITFSKHIEIDGIAVINPNHYVIYGGQSQRVTIRNVKAFSSSKWSDGIDLMSCSDVDVVGVFLRTSDDCIAIYGHRWEFYGDAANINIQDSTLGTDVAYPINVGTHGNPDRPETIECIAVHNVDILNHDEPQLGYQGCIALNASDSNLIRNVRVEDVRIDDFERDQLLNTRVTFNKKYATAPGRGIEDVRFKNVYYAGRHAEVSIIAGYDATRSVRNVVFENLSICGQLIWDGMEGKPRHFQTSDLARVFIGEHVGGVQFIRREGATSGQTC
ncbi:MAG: glycosyl hydrolase family 28 protein [Tepidisphaeraceae bacterium]